MGSLTDFVLPFQFENIAIRGRFVRLKDTVKDILERHQYPPLVNRLLEELITLGVGLANLFKFEGIFTLQINGSGPLRLMVVDITHTGEIRACAQFDKEKILILPLSTKLIYPILGTGYMAFTIDQNNSDDRYQGIVELKGSTLGECLHHFFRQSDQLETGLIVFTNPENINTADYLAATLIIQRMPVIQAPSFAKIESENDAWLRSLSLMGTATSQELLSSGLSAEDVLFRLFWEESIRIFEKRFFMAKCRCSEERIIQMLKTFPVADMKEMIKDGKIFVTCEFCNQSYTFVPQELLVPC